MLRLRITAITLVLLPLAQSARAQDGKVLADLVRVIAKLQADVETLKKQNREQTLALAALSARTDQQNHAINSLQADVASAADKLRFVSVIGTEMYITGANLNIRNGLGSTDGLGFVSPAWSTRPNTNSLGNLVIGYNEPVGYVVRIGSHNLVVGAGHSYDSVGGFVAGFQNTISGMYATVSGGANNLSSSTATSVIGGQFNTAGCFTTDYCGDGSYSSVIAGSNNFAHGNHSLIAGGDHNQTYMNLGSAIGGRNNVVGAQDGVLLGGYSNRLDDPHFGAVLIGGALNTNGVESLNVLIGTNHLAPIEQ